jgi:hypothetical protein
VLLPAAAEKFRALRDVRHRALHFNPATDRDAEPQALGAIALLNGIVSVQFGAVWMPWFIPEAHGLSFVRKDQEAKPFVARIVLPSCVRVGPAHDLRPLPSGGFEVVDDGLYADEEISDEDFVRRFVAAHEARPPSVDAGPRLPSVRATSS